jgi:hypothetical protein
MEENKKEIEADDIQINYRRLTREERLKIPSSNTDVDYIKKELQKEFEASREVFNETTIAADATEIEDYRILERAWICVVLERYPYIKTHVNKDIIDLLLDEKLGVSEFFITPELDPSLIVTIKKGNRGSFIVDNILNQMLVTDIPSAVKAIKFFDKTYKELIRGKYYDGHPKVACWQKKEDEDDGCY